MNEFFEATFPWISLGLILAISCAAMSKKEK